MPPLDGSYSPKQSPLVWLVRNYGKLNLISKAVVNQMTALLGFTDTCHGVHKSIWITTGWSGKQKPPMDYISISLQTLDAQSWSMLCFDASASWFLDSKLHVVWGQGGSNCLSGDMKYMGWPSNTVGLRLAAVWRIGCACLTMQQGLVCCFWP